MDKLRHNFPLELLLLGTAFLPAFFANVGFLFGLPLSALCFYFSVALMLLCAGLCGWRRSVSYLVLLGACLLLTAYTFSYVGSDAQNYHFPMQDLLRHGWNPIRDVTIERVRELAGDARFSVIHTLFLPKFAAVSAAAVAAAFGLFSGDGFQAYLLMFTLFLVAGKFATRFWKAGAVAAALFSAAVTASTKITAQLIGQVDYSVYAAFCLAVLSLALYLHENRRTDLALFAISACICMSLKSTGFLFCFVLGLLTLPWLWRRREYWVVWALIGVCSAINCTSPYLTAWIHYGTPFYPFVSVDPRFPVVDVTNDFTGNADALGMGYLARICYAWVSPQLTVAAERLFTGNPCFNPVFNVYGGVAGIGLWFNALLALSAVLLACSRKNLVTGLCVILFVSSNFAPLKYIGYNRYFPQIWAIFPLAVMNFACGARQKKWMRASLLALMLSLALLSFVRSVAFFGRMSVLERLRQDLIAILPTDRPIRVGADDYVYAAVARFRQVGRQIVRSNGPVDIVMQKEFSMLPCRDASATAYDDFNKSFPLCNTPRALVWNFNWLGILKNIPHVLRE